MITLVALLTLLPATQARRSVEQTLRVIDMFPTGWREIGEWGSDQVSACQTQIVRRQTRCVQSSISVSASATSQGTWSALDWETLYVAESKMD